MRRAIKRPVTFTAFQLGKNDPLEEELIRSGAIRRGCAGSYEVFSQEAQSGKGEAAQPGDYVKIDSRGCPYPNRKELFEKTCVQVGENRYRQFGLPVEVWFADEPMNETISFLISTGRLRLDETSDRHYFQAELWGAPLSAARDAAVILRSVTRDSQGRMKDVDFYFVERSEFERTYEWC